MTTKVKSELFKQTINTIVSSLTLGIGLSDILRSQSENIRTTLINKAKERAMKAPVKMMFPMVMFIFPVIFIVVLAPVVIKIFTSGVF